MAEYSTQVPGAINGGTIGCNAQIEVSAGNTFVWKIPSRIGSIGLQEYITESPAEYTVSATMNTIDRVEDGTAYWFDLLTGQTVSRQHVVMPSVTAVKIEVIIGKVEFAIRGQ